MPLRVHNNTPHDVNITITRYKLCMDLLWHQQLAIEQNIPIEVTKHDLMA